MLQPSPVTSFIEKLNSLVPVTMICAHTVVICLYDCKTDALLLSELFEWIVDDSSGCGTIVKHGIFLLWIAIHHRYKYKMLQYIIFSCFYFYDIANNLYPIGITRSIIQNLAEGNSIPIHVWLPWCMPKLHIVWGSNIFCTADFFQ